MSKGNPKRGIRMSDELWREVQAGCAAEGIDASTLVRQLLRGWLNMKDEGETK